MLFTILYKLNLTKCEMVRHKACKVYDSLPNLAEQVNVSKLTQGKWTTLSSISFSLKLLYGTITHTRKHFMASLFSAFTQELKSALILST